MLHGSVKGPRISPLGTPSWGSESGPRRYCELALGPGGCAGGADFCCLGVCARAIAAKAMSVRPVVYAAFFMEAPIAAFQAAGRLTIGRRLTTCPTRCWHPWGRTTGLAGIRGPKVRHSLCQAG